MTPLDLDKAVAEHPFVQGLSPQHLRILTASAMFTQFDAGQVVFREGEIANRFYLIHEGQVSVETAPGPAAPISVQRIGAGDVLGWSWLFPPYYWHFNACAIEPTRAIFFYGTRLREHCEEDREFGYQLMRRVAAVLMKRLQATIKETLRLAGHQPPLEREVP